MRRHLVAIDGRPEADFAFEWYLNNVNRPGDEVVIFHNSKFVLNIPLPGAMVNVEAMGKKVQDAMKASEEITQRANEQLRVKGCKGYVVVKSGMKPADAILQAAQEEKVHHIICGTRNFGPLKRVISGGSVSTTVASNAKCPVTVVKCPPT